MTIAHYTIAGQAVESEISLPELESRPGEGADILRIRLGRIRPAARRVVAQERLENGRLWRVVFGAPEGYLFHFPDIAVFLSSPEGTSVEVFPDPGIPEETVRHLLLDQVLPYLTEAWGLDAFHASGLVTPRGAVAFLGVTGRGKSTLAAALARRGFPVLCDDCFCVHERANGSYRARPWYPGVRLWPDQVQAVDAGDSTVVAHYTRKRRTWTPPVQAVDHPLSAMVLLDPPASDGRVGIRRISPRDAAVELTRHAFFLDPQDFPRFRRFFDRVARMSENVPMFRLSYPRTLEALDRVAEEIGRTEWASIA